MRRRTFLLSSGVAALSATPLAAFCQSVFAPQTNPSQADQSGTKSQLNPFVEIGNFADDHARVFLFFSYACSFCAEYSPQVVQWSKTFPKTIQLVRVPIATKDKSTQIAAMTYYVMREIAPDRLDEFDALCYSAFARDGIKADALPGILDQMKIPRDQIQAALRKKTLTVDRMTRGVILADRYNANVTPHFGVGGRFATNVTFTNGNYRLLVDVLNVLVSQMVAS